MTELCEGSDLIEAASQKVGGFSEPEVAYIILQLLLAINYCHK